MGKFSNLRAALRDATNKPLMLQSGSSVMSLLTRLSKNEDVSETWIACALAGDEVVMEKLASEAAQLARPRLVQNKGGKATAILSMRGVALYDVEFQPLAFSTLHLSRTVAALAADPSVGSIILDIDSPGGSVTGVPEAADAVFAAAQRKPVTAIVNPLAASAAYYIASQANEIIGVPSSDTGSIGVYVMHQEISEMAAREGVKVTFISAGENKLDGNAYEPLSETARAHIQSEVDLIYTDFLSAVARGRKTSVSRVEKSFGQGRTFMAAAARSAGMIDKVMTLDKAYASVGLSFQSNQRMEAETPAPVMVETHLDPELLTETIDEEVENTPDLSVETDYDAKRKLLRLLEIS